MFYDGYGKTISVETVEYENPLNGKNWLPLGDSITTGSGYPNILRTHYGASIIGGGFADGRCASYVSGSDKCALEKLDEIVDGTPDIITVALGTNDWGNSCPLGEISDTSEAQSESDFTFYGCYKKLVEDLQSRYPHTPMVLFTPFKRVGFANKNSAGNTLEEFADAIKDIAQHYSFVCCDLFSESGLPVGTITDNTDRYHTGDGLHFNRSAMAIAVPKMGESMKLAIQQIYIPCVSMLKSADEYTLTTTNAQRIYANPNGDCTERVYWESSNPDVVKVEAEATYIYAQMTAVANGTAAITAKCGDYTATFAITVALA